MNREETEARSFTRDPEYFPDPGETEPPEFELDALRSAIRRLLERGRGPFQERIVLEEFTVKKAAFSGKV